jgi:hypothetical protein
VLAGIISAGFFGILSREIARWHRCDMLTVFFAGAVGAALANLLGFTFSPIHTFVGFCLGAVLIGRIISRRRTQGSAPGGVSGDVTKSLSEKFRSVGGVLAVYAILTGGCCGPMGLFYNPRPHAATTPTDDVLRRLAVVITITSVILVLGGCL